MSPQGIGGDDRAGVYMILEIIKQANCHVLFCEDEEIGDIGAKKFVKSNMPLPVYYIIELDRQRHNDAVYYWNLLSNVCVTFPHSMIESTQVQKLIAKGRQYQCLTILYARTLFCIDALILSVQRGADSVSVLSRPQTQTEFCFLHILQGTCIFCPLL